jgi:hypothetical protein
MLFGVGRELAITGPQHLFAQPRRLGSSPPDASIAFHLKDAPLNFEGESARLVAAAIPHDQPRSFGKETGVHDISLVPEELQVTFDNDRVLVPLRGEYQYRHGLCPRELAVLRQKSVIFRGDLLRSHRIHTAQGTCRLGGGVLDKELFVLRDLRRQLLHLLLRHVGK